MNRQQQLVKLGFKINEAQMQYSAYWYQKNFYVSFIQISDCSESEWRNVIENIDFEVTYLKKNYQTLDSYQAGMRQKKKQTDKIILDLLNKIRSNLADVQRVKLTKIIDEDKIKLLEGQILVLIELQNKLK